MEIAPGIRRLGTGIVNVYLIEETGSITIVDAGLPGYWGDLVKELAAIGRTIEDVRAVVLTHAHTDHIGFAERIRRGRDVPIRIHDADAALARGEVKQQNEGGGKIRLGPVISFLVSSYARWPMMTSLPSGSTTRATRSPHGWSRGSSVMVVPAVRSRSTTASQSAVYTHSAIARGDGGATAAWPPIPRCDAPRSTPA